MYVFLAALVLIFLFVIIKLYIKTTPPKRSSEVFIQKKTEKPPKREYASSLNTKELRFVELKGIQYDNRENVLADCTVGDPVILKRESYNKYDRNAIAVLSSDGRMLGYLPRKSMSLAKYLDNDGKIVAHIRDLYKDRVPRGGEYVEGLVCILDIVPYETDTAKEYISEDYALKQLIHLTYTKTEENSLTDAISAYRDAIKRIEKLDRDPTSRKYRTVEIPINRLSMMLERNKQFKECIEAIEWYLYYNDKQEINYKDKIAIDKRLERVKKKLGNSYSNNNSSESEGFNKTL